MKIIIHKINNMYIKIVVLLFVVITLESFVGCNKNEDKHIGSGTPGVVEAFDWSKYDKLIEECKKEKDQTERSKKIFKAENMLLDTGAVIPLFGSEKKYLCRETLDGFYISCSGIPVAKYSVPKDGKKELNVCICTEPGSFDPVQATTLDTATVVQNYTGNLFIATEKGYEEELAKSMDISEDGMTYTIKIKEDAKWSDGVDVRAQDFEYTWNRAADPKNAAEYGFMFDPIELIDKDGNVVSSDDPNKKSAKGNKLNVKSVDDKTLKVKLKAPCPYFKSLMGHSSYAPIRKDIVEHAEGYDKNVFAWGTKKPTVTCGAFSVESWKHNSSIVLKKNPNYVFADRVKVDTLNLMLSSDISSTYSAYETGNIDVNVSALPSDELSHIMNRADFHKKQSQSESYIYFNVKADIFKGMTANEAKNFRKAIGYILDRTFMVKTVLTSQDIEEGRIIPKTIHDGTGKLYYENIKRMKGSPVSYSSKPNFDKARQMLKDIGFTFDKDGKIEQDIALEYSYNTDEVITSIATCVQADFAELGIKLITRSMDWNVFNEERIQGKFEAARGMWGPDYDDPMTFLDMFTTDSEINVVQLGRIE